jgi:tRNA-dihydrouridine synthase B
MIGRGVLRNPYLAEEIKFNTIYPDAIKLEKIIEFHNDLFNEYSKVLSGPSHITDKMKGLWTYLADSFEESKKIQKKIKKTHNVKSYLKVINDFFLESLRKNENVSSTSGLECDNNANR